jgi:hypothetical protein
MKRIAVFVVSIMAFVATFAGALPISIGSGVSMGMESINLENQSLDSGSWGPLSTLDISLNTIGASLFVDFHYAYFSLNISQGEYAVVGRMPNAQPDMFGGRYSSAFIDANLVGKLPISLYSSQSILIFPMVGLGYRLSAVDGALDAGNNEGIFFDPSFNSVRLIFGLGADFNFNENVFLRLLALPYYHFPGKVRKGLVIPDSANKSELIELPGGYGMSGGLTIGFRLTPILQGSAQGNGRPQRTVPETTSPGPYTEEDLDTANM